MEAKGKAGVPRKLSAVLMSLLLVAVIALNIGCAMFANVITQFFSTANVDEAAASAAAVVSKDLVERVEREAVVLLENKGGALPLDTADPRQANVNVFGWASVNPVYGGMGSGSKDESGNVSFFDGLESAGFHVNQDLVQFYESQDFGRQMGDSFGLFHYDFRLFDVPAEQYSEQLKQSAKEFSDVAIIFLSRPSGSEDSDVPVDMSEWAGPADHHFLELCAEERSMIDMVKSMRFGKVIVVVNTSNAMELGFLEEEGIDAALWIGGPGATGMTAVGQVFSGAVAPSGRLVDTYAYDSTSAPSFLNFGDFTYTNSQYEGKDKIWQDTTKTKYEHFVDYAEGIYVGYRYYETRWIDNATGACDEAAYRAAVQYPFGYGLSYTSFDQSIQSFSASGDSITVEVAVTNTGAVPGKDVVQLYYTPPYYVGGIEKSHVNLVCFAKTGLLDPGQSQTLSLTFRLEDMASFDYRGRGCYVLDAGTYQIKLMKNAHEVIDQREYALNAAVVYNETNKRSTDQVAALSLFGDAESDGHVSYVSRADWAGTLPRTRTPDREASQALLDHIRDYTTEMDPNAPDIVIKDNGLKLKDMVGLSYDDPKWDLLLEQITVEEMSNLIGLGGYATQLVPSIDKPYTVDIDGPAGLNALINETAYKGVQYTSGVTLASTWNVDLAREMGECYGKEANAWGVSGLYAPGMNTHRSPFGGRNFEYYSEDGYLAGKIAAGEVGGIQAQGVYCYLKHYAFNDQEKNRHSVCTWMNEQSIREIYLRPFELAVKEGGATGLMSSFCRVGGTWTGASHALMTDVPRGEWGFRGMVITDYYNQLYQNTNQAIRAGNDLMLSTRGGYPLDITSNAAKQDMRNACHNILYTVANSNAMRLGNFGPTPYWLYALIALDVVVAALEVLFFYRWNKKRKEFGAPKES